MHGFSGLMRASVAVSALLALAACGGNSAANQVAAPTYFSQDTTHGDFVRTP